MLASWGITYDHNPGSPDTLSTPRHYLLRVTCSIEQCHVTAAQRSQERLPSFGFAVKLTEISFLQLRPLMRPVYQRRSTALGATSRIHPFIFKVSLRTPRGQSGKRTSDPLRTGIPMSHDFRRSPSKETCSYQVCDQQAVKCRAHEGFSKRKCVQSQNYQRFASL